MGNRPTFNTMGSLPSHQTELKSRTRRLLKGAFTAMGFLKIRSDHFRLRRPRQIFNQVHWTISSVLNKILRKAQIIASQHAFVPHLFENHNHSPHAFDRPLRLTSVRTSISPAISHHKGRGATCQSKTQGVSFLNTARLPGANSLYPGYSSQPVGLHLYRRRV